MMKFVGIGSLKFRAPTWCLLKSFRANMSGEVVPFALF